MKYPDLIKPAMIAPCGMNCAICIGYLRKNKPCSGCNGNDGHKPKYCSVCRIKTCDAIEASQTKYCYSCGKFPCARLKQLDKRYRTKYRMSMVENLENIRAFGMKEFIKREKPRWTCKKCGGIIVILSAIYKPAYKTLDRIAGCRKNQVAWPAVGIALGLFLAVVVFELLAFN